MPAPSVVFGALALLFCAVAASARRPPAVDKPLATGNAACCMTDGTCVDLAGQPDCEAIDGIYQGAGTSCATTTCPVTIPSGHDCWFAASCEEGLSRAGFGADGAYPAVPADFFGPGSDPYVGTVALGQGFTDTVMFRFDDMTLDPCATTTFEMIQLSLAGCAPITVTFGGGQNPRQWHVTGLSIRAASLGTITACRTDDTGGRFDSTLTLESRWEFTPAAGGDTLVWLPPAIELAATGGPFCHSSTCTDLPFCNPYYRPGYTTGSDGSPCCQTVCYRGAENPADAICIRPVAQGPCPQCPQIDATVPTLSNWGLVILALLVVCAASNARRPQQLA